MDNDQQKFISQSLTFWDKLSGEEKELILNHVSRATYRKGEHIHSGESDCVGILLIRKGELRTYILSEDGREITLYRLNEGNICILSASCILKDVTFDIHIDAEQDSEVLVIQPDVFQRISDENVHVENFTYRKALDHFSDVIWVMKQIIFMSFDRRLAIFLLDEAERCGSNTILLTHDQMARYMGSAREVVSRMLKYFANEGYVELTRGGVKILNSETLLQLTGKIK
jgi:CRP/FNR family transcriptional regulator